MVLVVSVAPLLDQVFGGLGPIGEIEFEAGVEQAGGDDTAALEHQFGLGAEKEGADLHERSRDGQAVGHVPRLRAARAMNSRLGSGIGRGDIDGTVQVVAVDQEFDGAGEVGFVNPGDELAAVALLAAQDPGAQDSKTSRRRCPAWG